jgi:hypothetical protein
MKKCGLLLSSLLGLCLVVGTASVAAIPGTNDYSKNFLYKPDPRCLSGSKGKDFEVVHGRNDMSIFACIRLKGDNAGYAVTPLPPPNALMQNNVCGESFINGPHSEVYTVDGKGFGLLCVTVTDSTKWDMTGYKTPIDGGNEDATYKTGDPTASGDTCGEGDTTVHTSINIGCKGQGNPILDLMFALIRFLSIGVGIVVIGSIVVAGIQYTASRGDPSATAKALTRIYSTVAALAIYLFSYAILNWLIPGQIFK